MTYESCSWLAELITVRPTVYHGVELELEGEEDRQRHADEVESHQVGERREMLPPTAPRHACTPVRHFPGFRER